MLPDCRAASASSVRSNSSFPVSHPPELSSTCAVCAVVCASCHREPRLSGTIPGGGRTGARH
jgi:hypothetical protein